MVIYSFLIHIFTSFHCLPVGALDVADNGNGVISGLQFLNRG